MINKIGPLWTHRQFIIPVWIARLATLKRFVSLLSAIRWRINFSRENKSKWSKIHSLMNHFSPYEWANLCARLWLAFIDVWLLLTWNVIICIGAISKMLITKLLTTMLNNSRLWPNKYIAICYLLRTSRCARQEPSDWRAETSPV